MEEDFDDDMMDACLIAAGQRAEHDEMAAHGTTLDEEKAADEKLSVSRKEEL